jgi:hypothetical protein
MQRQRQRIRRVNGRRQYSRKLILPYLGAVDGRTRPAQLFQEIAEAIATDRGGQDLLTKAEFELARRAAGCGVLADDYEQKLIRGEPIDVLGYVQVCGRQCRILVALGLDRRMRPIEGRIIR